MRWRKMGSGSKFALVVAAGVSAVCVLRMVGYLAADEMVQFPTTSLIVTQGDVETSFSVELAIAPEQIARGLMFRESMEDQAGMLFVLAKPQKVSMWMKNTPMPLDMIFADVGGRVKFIRHDTQPFSEELISYGDDIQYVLEVKAGTASRLQLSTEARISSPGLIPPH